MPQHDKSSKKIGIVTYCGNNFGSVLQCYASQYTLSKYGIKGVLLKRYETGLGSFFLKVEYRLKRMYKYIRYPKYKDKFNEMIQLLSTNSGAGMNSQSQRLTNDFIEKSINSVSLPYSKLKKLSGDNEYLAFFSGSDQIWSATWFIVNNMWFLRFADKEKRVAWMPSFGSENVTEYNVSVYSKYIKQYAFLSSREKRGVEIIQELTGKTATELADPVVLLTEDEWREFADLNCETDEYILMFFLDTPSDAALGMMKKLHEYTGYKIVTFSYEHESLSDTCIRSGGPEEFVSFINNAKFVLTDSFHASMFSLMLDVPFYVFYRNVKGLSKQSSRIDNLLNTYDMKSRLIEEERDITESDFCIDTESKNLVLEKKRQEILSYLENVLTWYSEN